MGKYVHGVLRQLYKVLIRSTTCRGLKDSPPPPNLTIASFAGLALLLLRFLLLAEYAHFQKMKRKKSISVAVE